VNIEGKVIIITGASSGIGRACAKLFSQHGAKLILAARSKEKIESLSKELPNSLAIQTDMTEELQIKEMVAKAKKHFGRIDALINNAGQGYDSSVENINTNTFRGIFNLDIIGPVVAMQAVIPIMRSQKQGTIVNISSGTALMTLPDMSTYASLKQALAKISLTARDELKNDNIIVSVVYPYITATDFEKNTIKEEVDDWDEDGGGPPRPPDSAEYIAEKILEGIKSGEAEIYAHEWMKNRK
jgi:short-subunit dehydrogenase